MNKPLLSQYKIAYPIFKVLAHYRYRKVGTPTIFDELLMSLVDSFPQLKNNSLNDILETVQLDKIFIRHTLKNLLDTGLIEYRYFDEDLDNVRISELVLTENGKKFYREKKMPGKPRKAQEDFYFNPLSRAVANTNNISEKNPKTDLQLDCNLFSLNDEILQHLSWKNMKDMSWVTADVELEANGISTQVDDDNIKWQEVDVQLSLDQNRNLTIECRDILFKHWLNSLDNTFLRENLLSPLLKRAESTLSSKETLDSNLLSNSDKDLLNFTLADKNISVDNTVLMLTVTENNQELIPKNLPLIILSQLHEEATLIDQTLFMPNEWTLPENLTKIFVSIEEDQLFAEFEGYLPAYFEHQDIHLPIKYIEKWNKKLTDFDTFKNPNVDTLVFLAKYKTEQDILEKLPKMRIQQAVEFAQRIKGTWQKNFVPSQWSEKIEQLNTEEELKQFVELFRILPEFAHLDIKLQNTQIDLALKDPKSQAAGFGKLKDLVKLSNDLAKFNGKKLQLNLVSAENLEKLNQWGKIIIDFAHNNSVELTERNENFISRKEQILALFEPVQENEKFAVLDTNYIIDHSERLVKIQNSSKLILPKMVLAELDKLKKETQTYLLEQNKKLEKIKSILQIESEKVEDFQNQIEQCSSKLELLDKSKIDEIKKINAEKAELEKTKKLAEQELKKVKEEQSKIEKNRKEIDEKAYKIRKAANQLSELKFESVDENQDILNILEPTKAIADDKILAVACAYKLNDITLYTGDNILKAKANSIGLKTSS